jgi:hypothetical protein
MNKQKTNLGKTKPTNGHRQNERNQGKIIDSFVQGVVSQLSKERGGCTSLIGIADGND